MMLLLYENKILNCNYLCMCYFNRLLINFNDKFLLVEANEIEFLLGYAIHEQ